MPVMDAATIWSAVGASGTAAVAAAVAWARQSHQAAAQANFAGRFAGRDRARAPDCGEAEVQGGTWTPLGYRAGKDR